MALIGTVLVGCLLLLVYSICRVGGAADKGRRD
jgi:hypothetical protein